MEHGPFPVDAFKVSTFASAPAGFVFGSSGLQLKADVKSAVDQPFVRIPLFGDAPFRESRGSGASETCGYLQGAKLLVSMSAPEQMVSGYALGQLVASPDFGLGLVVSFRIYGHDDGVPVVISLTDFKQHPLQDCHRWMWFKRWSLSARVSDEVIRLFDSGSDPK